MSATFLIFGYGSLIFAPERPDHVLGLHPARLRGFRRTFSRRARSRSCARHMSFDAFTDVPDAYRTDDLNWSLALGTQPDSAAVMDGFVVEYPVERRPEVLAVTDRRESYDATRPSLENGYLRAEYEVFVPNGVRPALVYLSNPDPRTEGFVPEHLSLVERAKILINATPRDAQPGDFTDARGLQYLEGVRRGLARTNVVDPDLEALAAEVHALDGPWRALLHPPRRTETN